MGNAVEVARSQLLVNRKHDGRGAAALYIGKNADWGRGVRYRPKVDSADASRREMGEKPLLVPAGNRKLKRTSLTRRARSAAPASAQIP